MKKLALILMIISSSAMAQKLELISGKLTAVKGQRTFLVKFSYDSMMIGPDTLEASHLAKKKADWNMKEAGKGDEFERIWFDERKTHYEPIFIHYFEKISGFDLGVNGAPYTLLVKTMRTEPGWNIGIASHGGQIDGEVWIVESQTRER